MLRAGERRHIIEIQAPTETRDESGSVSTTWATVAGMDTVYAAIWPIRARERINQAQLELQITHRINTRYIEGVTAKHRIKFGSRIFDIESIINPDERNVELDILCIEASE